MKYQNSEGYIKDINIQKLKERIVLIEKSTIYDSRYINKLYTIFKKIYIDKQLKEFDIANKMLENTVINIKEKSLNILNVSKKNISIKNLNQNDASICIDINTIEIGKNWLYDIHNSIYSILKNVSDLSIEEIKINMEKALKKCIEDNKKYKLYEIQTNKTNISKIINKIKFLHKQNANLKINENLFFKNMNDTDIIDIYKYEIIINSISIIYSEDLKQAYSKLYDTLCGYLDREFKVYNFCDFLDNKCIAQRDEKNKTGYPINNSNGCCYMVEEKKQCKYLNNHKCENRCISCKIITCKYLVKKGISYYIHNDVYARNFLHLIQRPVFVWNFFKTKEEIISELKRYVNFKI